MLLIILFSYYIPIDSPLMDNIEYLQVKGLLSIPTIRPYDMNQLLPELDELVISEYPFNRIDTRSIADLSRLMTKQNEFSTLFHFKTHYDNDTLFYLSLDSRIGGRIASNFVWGQAIKLRLAKDIDSLGPKPWKEHVQAYLEDGYFGFDDEKIKVLFGRLNYLLGSGDEYSLLFSPDPQGYDGYFIHIPAKYCEFYTIFSVLDPEEMRFISIHRLGLDLGKMTFGFSEAILFTRDLEPLYLNFFLPYYLEQWGLNRDDNIIWNLDCTINYKSSIIYGELLIDDYMYEDDPYPSKLGYQVGLKFLMFDNFFFKFNYSFVDKWVYTHEDEPNTYENHGYPIGPSLGNDFDRISCSLKFLSRFGLNPKIVVHYTRKGEGSIFLPYEQEGGDWNPPFPSGVVQKSLDARLGLDYCLRNSYYLQADIGRQLVTDVNHQNGNNKTETLFRINVWAVF